MWSALLKLDSRKNCFLSVPHKWGIDFSKVHSISSNYYQTIFICFSFDFPKSPVVKIQQTVGSVTSYVYATCIGDNGPLGDDMVVIGAQFARINNLSTEEITMFEICKDVAGSIVSAVAEPNSEGDWEMLVVLFLFYQSEYNFKVLKISLLRNWMLIKFKWNFLVESELSGRVP